MRLFVAVEVPAAARRAIDRIERPAGDDVRWAGAASWHVTLRFLGEVAASTDAEAALATVVADIAVAEIGPTPERVGPTAIALPVLGLDALADAVAAAFVGLPGEERRPFRGHLTLGRLRRPGRWPAAGCGVLPAPVRWSVTDVALVRSHLGRGPARYEAIARRPLGSA